MISFDVVSLFAKVPIQDSMQAIQGHSRLLQDESLEDRTIITIDYICHLTEMFLRSTYFQFQDAYFEQVDGATMGSPFHPQQPTCSYSEELEDQALETATFRLRMWVRYVDDTIVLWLHDDKHLVNFHQHLSSPWRGNNRTKSRFWMSWWRENQRILLLYYSVYRKPTHTDQYINFASHHHPKTKTGVISTESRPQPPFTHTERRGWA